MATEIIQKVFSAGFTPEEIRERNTWHETTWIECEIPEALRNELMKIITQKVKDYKNKCQCGRCQSDKKNKKSPS